MFIEVTDSQTGARVSVNPNHICTMFDAGDKTIIRTIDGHDLWTVESYTEVLKKINEKFEK
ncbi:flagellar FlbD family protein [Bacillus salitolerans]|uniref:Flagellar FlbD family protein n=1 Tax=Bacillus salitolerans TaxID=1437434 RepID=A0ABW4LME6_9BACI